MKYVTPVAHWEQYWEKYKPSMTLLLNHLDISNKIPQGEMVLDIGCGTCELDNMLILKNRCTRIIAMDISEVALSAAKQQIMAGIHLIKASVFSMPFRDGSFDLVISTGSASVATYCGAMQEVKRVINAGGLLVTDFIRFPNIYHPRRSLKWLFVKRDYSVEGLKTLKTERINTFLPVGSKIVRIAIDKILRRFFSPVFARTMLVTYRSEK